MDRNKLLAALQEIDQLAQDAHDVDDWTAFGRILHVCDRVLRNGKMRPVQDRIVKPLTEQEYQAQFGDKGEPA